jgi:hypothetical protein
MTVLARKLYRDRQIKTRARLHVRSRQLEPVFANALQQRAGQEGRHGLDGSDAWPGTSRGFLRVFFFLRLCCGFCRTPPPLAELSC